MADFTVTVGGKEYDVTAPDERTAWAWANQIHQQNAAKPPRNIAAEIANDPITKGAEASLDPRKAMREDLLLNKTSYVGKSYADLLNDAAYGAGGKITDITGSPAAGTAVNAVGFLVS